MKSEWHCLSRGRKVAVYGVIAYVLLVLAVDLLPFLGLGGFRWSYGNGFDAYKFVFWLVVPLVLSLPAMDWHYFTFRRWKRADVVFLVVLTGAGIVALALVPHIPQLRAMYPDQSGLSPDVKSAAIQRNLLWNLSWLPGWEFLHRYFLLRAVTARWPRYGWILVPLSEGLYHLPKLALEALGMTAFSVAATQWSMRRRNMVLPFLAHAAIEMGLLFVLFA